MDCGTKAATLDQGVPSSAQRVLTVKIGRSTPPHRGARRVGRAQ